jgi:YVTN family beta-propeller protein
MNFRLLGDLEVLIDGQRLPLAGHKQRALLAVLLVHANQVVGPDRLIEDLWGDEPPARAAKSVQVHVWRLRKALVEAGGAEAGERLLTRASGYVLRVDQGELDVEELGRLVSEGTAALRDGQFERGGDLLREGVALWRGPPLAEFAYDSFAQQEVERVNELHAQAIQGRIDADLALGRHALLVGELEALVAEHPLAERLQAQLMLALYRSGRQADALDVYRQARRRLLDDLGLEPGEDLKRLQAAILSHDPNLDLAPPARPPAPSLEPATAASGRAPAARGDAGTHAAAKRLRPVLVVASLALLLVAGGVGVALVVSGGRAAGVTVAGNSVAVIDPTTNRVVAQASVGLEPGSITAGAGGVWVANTDDHTLSEIDDRTRKVVHTLALGSVDGVAATRAALWTVDSTRGVAQLIDPTFRTAVRTVSVGDLAGVGRSPNPLAVGDGAVWVANDASAVVRIPARGTGVSTIDVGNEPSGIAVGEGATWVTDDIDDSVSRIDSTLGVSAIPVGPGASGVAVGGGGVWVADTLADALVRIDPATDSVKTTIAVGSRPRGVAWGAGSVWVANSGDGTVSRVDPRSDRVTARIPVGQSPQALVVTARGVWVSVAARPPGVTSQVGSPPGQLRVIREPRFSSTDPALTGNFFDVQALQMYYARCAGLLTYPDKPAPQGARLVPDVAKSMPTISADGRTYTFTVRPGFRFSPPSGAPVTAATFKHTIERTLSPKVNGYARAFMGDIVGMTDYQAGRTRHLAGVTSRGDRLRIRLTAPAPDLPARIANLSFCAVPDDTPLRDQTQPVPSAGPYYIVPSTRDQVVLARNPNYAGHRPRIPKQIVYSSGATLPHALEQVETGASDYVNSAVFTGHPADLVASRAVEQRYGPTSAAARNGRQQYFITPTQDVEYFDFNTTRRVFATARMRRAVNYAIDRRALVQHHLLYNGGQAIDHYLPPGVPGSRPVHVYPLGAPDLVKARRLAAGVHAHATMYTCNFTGCEQEAQIVRSDLGAIGITVDIRIMSAPTLFARLARPGEPWDIAWANFGADFPDPFSMINELFDLHRTSFDFGRFNDPVYTRRMRRAATLTGQQRIQAYARLDEDLARHDAPVAAWGIGTAREFFSRRVGCHVYQPLYGTDLGTVCLRG